MLRPYYVRIVDDYDPMHMIRHNHMRAQFHQLKMIGNGTPTFVRDGSEIVQSHFCISDFPEQTIALIRDKGHKIRARL